MSKLMREIYLDNMTDNSLKRRQQAMDVVSAGVGSITSRDDIINPYEMIDPAMYGQSRRGKAQYESDLNSLLAFQSQQEAAYQEWYNSPEQAAIRERSAGLNPDLIGLDNAGDASSAPISQNIPAANLPSNGQVAIDAINTVSSVIGSALNVATLAAGIPNIGKQGQLLDSQVDAQKLANVGAFESIAHNAIASKFATYHAAQTAADSAADIASWFADDSNFADIIPSYAPSDDPMYQHALARVRKGSESILADAYGTNQQATLNQQSFARLLANPYANQNTVIMSALMEPMMQAIFNMEQYQAQYNADAAQFRSDAMSGIDATESGEIWIDQQRQDLLGKQYSNIIDQAKKAVFENLKKTYLSAPNSPAGYTAGMLILGHYQSSLEGLLVNYLTSLFSPENLNSVGDLINEVGTIDLDGDSATNEGFNGFKMGRSTK